MKDKVNKAKNVSKNLKKPIQKSKYKIRTSCRFRRPKSKLTMGKPLYVRKITTLFKEKNTLSQNKILIQPVASDKNMNKMENENTITFLVNPKANKALIKNAFKKIYNANVRSVNTLHTSKGKKKAYIRLEGDSEAYNIASKIGII